MKTCLQWGALLLFACCLTGTGCSGSNDASLEPVADGIPEAEYELFSNLIHNLDEAKAELATAQKARNPVHVHRAQSKLEQQTKLLDRLFVQKYDAATVQRWETILRRANISATHQAEEELRGEELLSRFSQLGAKGTLDQDGYITQLDCRNLNLPDDLFTRIANCQRLKDLNLRGTQREDEHLQYLNLLTQLTKLDLSDNPNLKGDRLSQLTQLQNLRDLNLSGTGVHNGTLSQFESLSHLKKLRTLNVSRTKLSNESYERITRIFRLADVSY